MSRLHSRRMTKYGKVGNTIGNILIKLVPIVTILVLIWSQNNFLVNESLVFSASNLPKSFVGYKVTHISDLCNTNINVVKKVKKAQPNIILISGGYNDSNGNSSRSVKIVEELTKIAPVYYIYNMEDTEGILSNTSATSLVDNVVSINPVQKDASTFIKDNYGDKIIKEANKGDEDAIAYIDFVTESLQNTYGSTIDICGLSLYDYDYGYYDAYSKTQELIGTDADRVNILLNGNIANLSDICRTDVSMVFFGGTFGTNYISDDYEKGIYGNHGTQLFVSGGVGKHQGITRIFNFPQIQTITLSDGTIKNHNPLEKFISIFFEDVGTIFDNDGGFQNRKYNYKTDD